MMTAALLQKLPTPAGRMSKMQISILLKWLRYGSYEIVYALNMIMFVRVNNLKSTQIQSNNELLVGSNLHNSVHSGYSILKNMCNTIHLANTILKNVCNSVYSTYSVYKVYKILYIQPNFYECTKLCTFNVHNF